MMLPLALPSMTEKERGYINSILISGDVGIGEYVGKFEKVWARKNKRKHAVACNSGTSALFLALKALGIGPGDEVLVPEFTMVAAAWSVTYTGAMPVFVDCTEESTNMDPDKMVFTEKTKAVIITPIYGRAVDPRVYEKARAAGVLIVEDFAEAHGIYPQGDVTCYSFYGNKIITTGEGGMCLTNHEDLDLEMRRLRNMYFDKDRSMIHERIGYNLRMTNLQAAIGLAQAERFEEIFEKRMWIQETYNKHINPKFKLPERQTLWMYDIKVEDQETMKRKLKRNGVDSRFFFKPMSAQPMYAAPFEHLNAYKWSTQGLYLPAYFEMTEGDIKYICRALE